MELFETFLLTAGGASEQDADKTYGFSGGSIEWNTTNKNDVETQTASKSVYWIGEIRYADGFSGKQTKHGLIEHFRTHHQLFDETDNFFCVSNFK